MKFSLFTLAACVHSARAFVPTVKGGIASLHHSTKPEVTDNTRSIVEDPETYEKAETPTEPPTPAQQQIAFFNQLGQPLEAFKGVRLGDWSTEEGIGDYSPFSIEKVLNEFVASTAPHPDKLIGKPKKDSAALEFLQEALIETSELKSQLPNPDDYQHFGNSDHVKQLLLLLKTNPFMASALTETSDGGFELKAYDPDEPSPTLFQRMVDTLEDKKRRVNFKFNARMEVESFTVFDASGRKLPVEECDRDKWASAAIYNAIFYASSIHATIHVFHFLLTSSLTEASKGYSDLHSVALSYANNVRNKYFQVGLLLISDPQPANQLGVEDAALLTGKNGFGSSQAIRPIMEELLNTMGQCKTARELFSKLMNVSEAKMQRAGILKEFRKHFKLVEPFSRRLEYAFRNADRNKFGSAEAQLVANLQDCGTFKCNIESIKSWLELMSVTGIIHGATLSYSRLLADPEVLRWRNIDEDTWDAADFNLVSGVLGTLVGIDEGKHVMGLETTGGGEGFSRNVKKIFSRYDGKAEALKEAYKTRLLRRDRAFFNNFGFILTDYGPDNFDGKQLTISTYV